MVYCSVGITNIVVIMMSHPCCASLSLHRSLLHCYSQCGDDGDQNVLALIKQIARSLDSKLVMSLADSSPDGVNVALSLSIQVFLFHGSGAAGSHGCL